MERPKPVGSKKCCCYYGCSNNSTENSTYTFFSFPKDDSRRDMWYKLAGVTPEAGENKTVRFLCEAHFANIYLCRSQRRTLLLHTAIPYPYDNQLQCRRDKTSISIEPLTPNDAKEDEDDSQDQIETFSIEEVHLVEEGLNDDNSSDEKNQIESQPVTVVPVRSLKRKDPIAKIAEMKVKLMKTAPNIAPIERKLYAMQKPDWIDTSKPRLVCAKLVQKSPQRPTTSVAEHHAPIPAKPAQKSPATSSTKTVQVINEAETKVNNGEESHDSKHEQISEFIFKGEEYVQMPKAVYNKQIEGLKRKVAHYETILQTMRNVMDEANVEDSLDN